MHAVACMKGIVIVVMLVVVVIVGILVVATMLAVKFCDIVTGIWMYFKSQVVAIRI